MRTARSRRLLPASNLSGDPWGSASLTYFFAMCPSRATSATELLWDSNANDRSLPVSAEHPSHVVFAAR